MLEPHRARPARPRSAVGKVVSLRPHRAHRPAKPRERPRANRYAAPTQSRATVRIPRGAEGDRDAFHRRSFLTKKVRCQWTECTPADGQVVCSPTGRISAALEPLADLTQALDRADENVSRLEVERRLARHTDARGRPGEDQVPGKQAKNTREVFDERRHVENQLVRNLFGVGWSRRHRRGRSRCRPWRSSGDRAARSMAIRTTGLPNRESNSAATRSILVSNSFAAEALSTVARSSAARTCGVRSAMTSLAVLPLSALRHSSHPFSTSFRSSSARPATGMQQTCTRSHTSSQRHVWDRILVVHTRLRRVNRHGHLVDNTVHSCASDRGIAWISLGRLCSWFRIVAIESLCLKTSRRHGDTLLGPLPPPPQRVVTHPGRNRNRGKAMDVFIPSGFKRSPTAARRPAPVPRHTVSGRKVSSPAGVRARRRGARIRGTGFRRR